MEALTKRVEKLEAYVKAHKERKAKKSVKKLNTIMSKMFPNRPKLLSEEKKEEPKEAPKAEASA